MSATKFKLVLDWTYCVKAQNNAVFQSFYELAAIFKSASHHFTAEGGVAQDEEARLASSSLSELHLKSLMYV